MFSRLIQKIKKITVTLRFSILTIFITLFVISMLTLISLTYFRSTASMMDLGFKLMRQSSQDAFDEIQNQMMNAKTKSKSIAKLVEEGIVDHNVEISGYSADVLQRESSLYPIVHSIYWGDEKGNFVLAKMMPDGSVQSEFFDRRVNPPTRRIIDRNLKGETLRSYFSPDLNFDPRTRPWYIDAKNFKDTMWTDVYQYRLSHELGVSVASPVYKKDGSLVGVISLNARLDYLRKIVENIHLSKNGVTFIISEEGQLVAFPTVPQLNHESLMDIHTLNSFPWVAASFERFKILNKDVFHFEFNNKTYMVSYQPLPNYSAHRWLIGSVVPLDDFIGDLRMTNLYTTVISLAILIFGIVLISHLVTRVIRPLNNIKQEIDRIKNFDLTETPRIVSYIKEICFIADALYSTKAGLRAFQKYVPASLVRQLIDAGEDVRIGGTKKPLAILFSDIKNFTTIAEQIGPDQLTTHLYDYFDALSHIITEQHGTIDKYIGDSIMAFWGAPLAEEMTSEHAALAALNCIKRSAELNKHWKLEGKPELFTRIGMNAGEAIVGNFGSSERLSYTAIGDAINTASRLEGVNKLYGTQILVSETMYEEIKNHFVLRLVDCVTLKGKDQFTNIYELMAEHVSELSFDPNRYEEIFTRGFEAYRAQKWDEAIGLFEECIQIYAEDKVAKVFIKRCADFKMRAPIAGWEGVWHFE